MTVAASGPGDARLAVERVSDDAGLAAAHALRLAVFVDEQGVPVEEEIDDLDTAETTTHVLVRDRERAGRSSARAGSSRTPGARARCTSAGSRSPRSRAAPARAPR